MIVFAGLGPGDADTLSRGAERALREAAAAGTTGGPPLLLRTSRHPSADILREWGLPYLSFDDLYDSAPDFQTLYEAIAARVVETAVAYPGHVTVYAVPGHPMFAEETVRLILDRAASLGIETRVAASGSFVEAALTAAGAEIGAGCDVRDALTLPLAPGVDAMGRPVEARPDTSRALLLYQVYDAASASQAKLALMRDYPDEWPVRVIRWAGVAGKEQVIETPLYKLDRLTADHLTSVFVPPLPPELRPNRFEALTGIMARLRAPDGCPWDREQTHQTLRRYMVEETYEVLEAIDSGDTDLLAEELGDALLQVVFHAQLASEAGDFTIDDVCEQIVTKLVRRHPHVFGAVQVADSDEVLRNWEMIKRKEKPEGWRPSVLDGVPRELPALMRAMEISKRAAKTGFEWESLQGVLAKLDEELSELRVELERDEPDSTRVEAEIGDLLFTVVQIARWRRLDPENALRTMLARFSARFQYIETCAGESGRAVTDLTPLEMNEMWEAAKLQSH